MVYRAQNVQFFLNTPGVEYLITVLAGIGAPPGRLDRGVGCGRAELIGEDAARVATQPVKLSPASTLVGRSRTMSSPGAPLRFPNSSARSGPM